MRISDWSSDVCSSDLDPRTIRRLRRIICSLHPDTTPTAFTGFLHVSNSSCLARDATSITGGLFYFGRAPRSMGVDEPCAAALFGMMTMVYAPTTVAMPHAATVRMTDADSASVPAAAAVSSPHP